MKPIYIPFIFTLVLLSMCLLLPGICYGQVLDPETKIQNNNAKVLVDNKSFVFVATSVSPSGGRMRQLTSVYTLKVDTATLVCDLPYFGRVYQPAYGGDAGLNFTSMDFDYKTEARKKGGWVVQIKTKDLKNNFQLRLTILEDDNATLQVNGADRQSISYSGSIKASEK
jgi:Domain of unknown function (DUF4251)